MKPRVFYEFCDGRPGAVPFEPGWGSYESLKEAIARLEEARHDGFADATWRK
jgi:hypothetical protein